MQSATSIQFISDSARNTFNEGGQSTVLTVNFRVFKRGARSRGRDYIFC